MPRQREKAKSAFSLRLTGRGPGVFPTLLRLEPGGSRLLEAGMQTGVTYMQTIMELLEKVRSTNWPVLQEVAPQITSSLVAGGLLHTYGSGHSAIIAQEMVHRAGGLACIGQMTDPTGGFAENVPGYGRKLAEKYHQQYGLEPGEWMIVISNSGKNASPLDVALYAREQGLRVLGLCSLSVSRQNRSEHPCGLCLHEVSDAVLDNASFFGDAAIELPGNSVKAGPTSTLTGALLLNLLHLEIIAQWQAGGQVPPQLRSMNTPGGREHNREIGRRYQHRVSHRI